MSLLDHFHPPLHGPRRWEGFHHAWATFIAQQLNQETLPPDYFAESEISLGPELEIDVATMEWAGNGSKERKATQVWSPARPKITAKVDFARLDSYAIHVYQDLGGPQLRAAVELVSPANKDRLGSRRTFAAKCAGYIKHGIGLVILDVVTARTANLHAELFEALEATSRSAAWKSPTGLYAVAYRAVTVRKSPRVEVWPEALALGKPLPVLPLWLSLDLCVPLRLEDSYLETCRSLRISA
ncbi:MAG: DUF4058 family protein [Gemmataceae bacterium]|nr:DUF4058 family protein [Gemmataceae bacterium]MCI0739949.1 DUF4058 family protein [Gemmataceae bacterium]